MDHGVDLLWEKMEGIKKLEALLRSRPWWSGSRTSEKRKDGGQRIGSWGL